MILHATAIALGDEAALIRGASATGKSDLALRCLASTPSALIALPARLVADDQVEIRRVGDTLRASAPSQIRGKLEVRGIGIVTVPCTEEARVALIVDLVAPREIERMPDAGAAETLLGVSVPRMALAAFESSAAAKLLLALRAAGSAQTGP